MLGYRTVIDPGELSQFAPIQPKATGGKPSGH